MTPPPAPTAARRRRWYSRWPSRLAVRLAAASLLVAAVSFASVFFTAAQVVRESAVAAAFANLDSVADVGLSNPPRESDRAALTAWALGLAAFEAAGTREDGRRSPGERRVTLVARDGTVLADSHEDAATMENHADRPEIVAAFATGHGRSQRFSETRGEELTYVAVRPAWSADTVLRLSEPVVRLEETVRAILSPVALAILVAAAIAAGLSFWFAARFSQRVARLREFSERVARGDFTPETSPLGMPELDELLASLNRTALALRNSFESLTAQRNQGATILSSMREGVAVLDRRLRIQYLNRAFRTTMALPGDSWRDYQGREARKVLEKKRLLKMVTASMGGRSTERTVSLGGREVLARSAPVRSPDEGAGRAATPAPAGAVLVLMDVTRLHALERVRRDFVANLSHELKTPLTAIRGFSETLLEGDLQGPPEQKRFLEIIREHAVRLSRLTDDLLRLARIEAGKLEPEFAPIGVRSVIESVVESARLRAGKRALLTPDAGGALRLETDPALLTEILQNLVGNAIQYSRDDGRVEIAAARAGDEIRISVADDGVGIPKRHRARIFERFYRVDPARSREVGGTGLGLAIARHTAGLLGGRIEVESAPGKGSRFTVILPRARPAAPGRTGKTHPGRRGARPRQGAAPPATGAKVSPPP